MPSFEAISLGLLTPFAIAVIVLMYLASFLIAFASIGVQAARAQSSAEYEPLVDEDVRGFKPAKYAKDLEYCRRRAAPHAARAAAAAKAADEGNQQVVAGTALTAIGGILGGIAVPSLSGANNLFAGSSAANSLGGAVAAGGAARQAAAGAAAGQAAGDYQLVIDNCLMKRGYRMLR